MAPSSETILVALVVVAVVFVAGCVSESSSSATSTPSGVTTLTDEQNRNGYLQTPRTRQL